MYLHPLLWSALLAGFATCSGDTRKMFTDFSSEYFGPGSNPIQLNYGVAISDVDNDGQLEIIVAGYNGPNLVLKWNNETRKLQNIAIDDPSSPFYALRDPNGNAIGVAACDIDGDGREEIYFLNTNQAYSGIATYGDKLFKFRNGRYEDILSDAVNSKVTNFFAGRSVAAVDRKGTGKYSIFVANYARGSIGPMALIEMDNGNSDPVNGLIALKDVAKEVGVAKLTGGRGVTVGPILNDTGISDIFCDNENGPNFLFRNRGDGTFEDVAITSGIGDQYENGRGVALADVNEDGKLDIIYGNWQGPHRIFLQTEVDGEPRFTNIAKGTKFETASPVRTVIAADFDNDGSLEIFVNNIAYRGPAPNRLFRIEKQTDGKDPKISELDIGDAIEPQGRGTGAAVVDIDGDGLLELLVSHGESAEQPLSLYKASQTANSAYVRIMPLTKYGAPARGAKVMLRTGNSGTQTRIIDGGSGYLCQMEPVAHFGIPETEASITIGIVWPDTTRKTLSLSQSDLNRLIRVEHPYTVGKERGINRKKTNGSRREGRRQGQPKNRKGKSNQRRIATSS